MKRILTTILAVLFLLSFTACKSEQKDESPVQFYFPAVEMEHGTDTGVIAAETRYFSHADALADIISVYFSGPESDSMRSPFPADLALVDLDLGSSKIGIVLSDHIATQSGIDLTLTCSCIQKTLKALTGVDVVQISAENEKINGQDVIILQSDRILLVDTEISNPAYPENTP